MRVQYGGLLRGRGKACVERFTNRIRTILPPVYVRIQGWNRRFFV